MRPPAVTRIIGVNACVVGTVLIRAGVDQVRPPSVDLAKAIAEPDGARVASCHTMYTDPLGPAAISGMMSPVRTAIPSSGSLMKPGMALATVIGAVQVAPRSFDLSTATSCPFLLEPAPWKSMNPPTRGP